MTYVTYNPSPVLVFVFSILVLLFHNTGTVSIFPGWSKFGTVGMYSYLSTWYSYGGFTQTLLITIKHWNFWGDNFRGQAIPTKIRPTKTCTDEKLALGNYAVYMLALWQWHSQTTCIWYPHMHRVSPYTWHHLDLHVIETSQLAFVGLNFYGTRN